MKNQKLIKKLLTSRCFYRAEDGRLIIKISSASVKGGQCQSIGGKILRAITAGEKDLILELPAVSNNTVLDIVHGAMIGCTAKIELQGAGAIRYQERFLDVAC